MALFNDKDKQKKFDMVLNSITKDFGTGSAVVLGEAKPVKIPRTSFGSYKLDQITGGGLPKGRIVEIYGPESSGKTTVALHAIAEVQRAGGVAVIIDAEHALDMVYAESLGVDVSKLVLSQPDTAEECLQIAERWIESGLCDLVVVDSVAAMVPRAEMNGDIGDNHVGLLARLMSSALRKLAGKAQNTGTSIIFINQLREKVNVMYGNPETTPGGRALKYYATIRLDVRPSEIAKREGSAVSRKVKVKVVKNKVAPPFQEEVIDIEFGVGISKASEILDYGADLGVLNKTGNWYHYGDIRLGNGREACKLYLNEHPEMKDEIDNKIRYYLDPTDDEYEEVVEEVPDFEGEEE